MRILMALGLATALIALPAVTSAQPRPIEPAKQQKAPAPKAPKGPSYGNWDSKWGAKPPAPPKHFTKTGDWHRHVRACQVRFKSYNPRTDTYQVRGIAKRCVL